MLSIAVMPDAAAAADFRFREFFEYWVSKAPPERLPGRQHIDPLELRQLLPGIALYDVIDEGGRLRFRCRLVGTAVVDAVGSDFTGCFMDDVVRVTTTYEALHGALNGVVRTRQPFFGRSWISNPERDHVFIDRLFLPLASDGTSVDMVIGYYVRGELPP